MCLFIPRVHKCGSFFDTPTHHDTIQHVLPDSATYFHNNCCLILYTIAANSYGVSLASYCLLPYFYIWFSLSWFSTLDTIFCILMSPHDSFPLPVCIMWFFQCIALSYHVLPVTFIFPANLADIQTSSRVLQGRHRSWSMW